MPASDPLPDRPPTGSHGERSPGHAANEAAPGRSATPAGGAFRRAQTPEARAASPACGPPATLEVELQLGGAAAVVQAAEELYRRYQERLHTFTFRLLGGRPAEADDVVQEVFVRLLRGTACYRGCPGILPWLCGIARHVAYDERRRRRRCGLPAEMSLEEGPALDQSPEDLSPITSLEKEEAREALLEALFSLPGRRRRILMLSLEGWTVARIASELGEHPDKIESQLRRARSTLILRVRRRRWAGDARPRASLEPGLLTEIRNQARPPYIQVFPG